MLYDVTSGEKKLNISTLNSGGFSYIAGSAIGQYLFLLGHVSNGTMAIRIDVTNYTFTKVLIQNATLSYAEDLTAVSDTEMMARVEEPVPNVANAIVRRVLYFDMSGNVRTVFDNSTYHSEVITLSDNQ